MQQISLLNKKYDVIYADPPWQYEHPVSNSRKIENHYNTMTLEDIKNLDIPATNNSVLFMWTTAPKLKEAFEVIDSWGFNYRTCLVWDKLTIGMGYWFRNQHEILLVAVKGSFSPPPALRRISSIFKMKKTEHSKKPDKIRTLISDWYPDKSKIELFSRNNLEGWDCWGNEAPNTTQKLLLSSFDAKVTRSES